MQITFTNCEINEIFNGSNNNSISHNYPNPFNQSTTIEFDLPGEGNVTIKVLNATGNEIEQLVSKRYIQGKHTINWNAEKLDSGIYYYSLEWNDYIEMRKMVIIK